MGTVRILLFLAFLLACWSEAKAQSGRDRLQPGDVVSITVYQDPKLDRQVLIGPTGMISSTSWPMRISVCSSSSAETSHPGAPA